MKIQPGRANKRPRTDETSGEAMDLANKHSELELENKRLKSQLRDTRVQLKKLRNQLQDARDEVKELTAKSRDQREQIICLKQEISAERDAPDYPTDYELGQDFQSLNSSIQAWAFGAMRDSKRVVIVNPGKKGQDFDWLKVRMPLLPKDKNDHTYNRYALACLLSRTLVDSLENDNTFGQGSKVSSRPLAEAEEILYSNDHHADYSKWLQLTKSLLDATEPQMLTEVFEHRVGRIAGDLRRVIRGATNIDMSLCEMGKLESIVRNAITFFNKIYFHPAKYAFTPTTKALARSDQDKLALFDDKKFEAIPSGAQQLSDEAKIIGYVFHGIYKARDERGEKIAPTQIVKAKVLTT